ncbi:23S rRNA (guanosine(2251)-2'-O)-methyltransferase RlmB [candidate division WWE3 bacterium CG10_big_fil_rev_8_21_14_0_10_32_10]|uniref:23S rRNA (Guanosine(2251)-2'-O)-methyltransferase RlmB n=1 Tax=candidate division WWE3 bacterium CG10_big_fil_rev_8_21_14_0_10_32_10 TaxID=1975090 RepID=A0A2H0RB48_UNCKA|nr:MAG: 23S rRNA (guanosine(2251)-2'-O)-methyltransferase RlmB [candidate division WWE3 bacterium CG10_big_fil_rev_8_21_14_0_10_32_10]
MQRDNLVNIEGKNSVIEVLKGSRYIKKIYIESSLSDDKIRKIINISKDKNISVEYVTRSFLRNLSKTQNFQGVIAMVEAKKIVSSKFYLDKLDNSMPHSVVLLRSITYEQNLGAIIRTCAACGVDAVVIPKNRNSKISPLVERISMGGVNEVLLIQESFYSALKNLKKAGFKMVALEVTGSKDYYEEDLRGNVGFILGSESETLDKNLLSKVDSLIKIPMLGNISSLNVSVATGIVLYERYRQMVSK